MRVIEKEFVLCPNRHTHPRTEWLPSVFEESLDIFNLVPTQEFKDFLTEAKDKDTQIVLNIYVTWLTPAYEKCRDMIENCIYQRAIDDTYYIYESAFVDYNFYHYDRNVDDYRTL